MLLRWHAGDVRRDGDVELGSTSGLGAKPLLARGPALARVLAGLLLDDECVFCDVLRLGTIGEDLVLVAVEGLVVADAALWLIVMMVASSIVA